MPAATILLGAFINRAFAGGEVRKTTLRIWGWTIGAFGFVAAGAGAVMAIQPERVQNDLIWISSVGTALLIGCGVLVVIISWWLLKGPELATRVFYAGAAVIFVGAWGNFTIVRPAFDPVKSTRYLSDALDMELANRNGSGERGAAVVGAVSDAAKAEYHVYGHYKVRGFRTADAAQATSDTIRAPDLMLLKSDSKQYSQIANSLVESGYTNRRPLVASKDSLRLFKKPVVSGGNAGFDPLNFLFVGDTGSGKPQIYNVVREMAKRDSVVPVDAVFLLGDNLYEGQFVSRSLEQLFVRPFAPLLSQKLPVYAALGNHDYDNDRMRGEVKFPLFNMAGRRYYTLDFGVGRDSISVFICDAESLKAGDEEQLAWLTSALAESRATWKILVLHRPMEATNISHGPSGELRRLLAPMLPSVDIVFSGHNHIYERRKITDGVLHITSGAGGQLTTGPLPPDNNRSAGYNSLGSFTQMEILDGLTTLTAWNEKGETVDRIILEAHKDGAGYAVIGGK